MALSDPLPTQRDTSSVGVPAELVSAGFEEPEEIGRGGFGVVYGCIQRALARTVAVEVLTADLEPDNLERFVREQGGLLREAVRILPDVLRLIRRLAADKTPPESPA